MAAIRLCVIGLGMGRTHASHFSEMPDVDVYDLDKDKVERASAELAVVGTFPTADEVFASTQIDAVLLALPHHLHFPLAIQAMHAGKHCLVEKPMALSLHEADEMVHVAETSGVRLGVAENYQFMADSTEGRRLIEAGAIGEPYMVRVHELWRIGPRPDSWWFKRSTAGGGELISLGIHSIRTLRVLAGAPALSVYALTASHASQELHLEGEDTSMLSVRFENGVIGSVVTSWTKWHPGPNP